MPFTINLSATGVCINGTLVTASKEEIAAAIKAHLGM